MSTPIDSPVISAGLSLRNEQHVNGKAIARRCVELASECLHLIPVMEDEQKTVLIELAEYWTALADRADRGESLDN